MDNFNSPLGWRKIAETLKNKTNKKTPLIEEETKIKKILNNILQTLIESYYSQMPK